MYRDSHTSQGYRVLYLYLSLPSEATKDRRESVGYKILHFHLVKCIWDVFISQSKITTVFQLWNPGFLKMLLSSCISESFFYLTLAWPKVKLNHFSPFFLRNCVGYNSGRSKIFSDTTIKHFFSGPQLWDWVGALSHKVHTLIILSVDLYIFVL